MIHAIVMAGMKMAGGLMQSAASRAAAKAAEAKADFEARTAEVQGMQEMYTSYNTATSFENSSRTKILESSKMIKSLKSDIRRSRASQQQLAVLGGGSDDLDLEAAIQAEKEVNRVSYIQGQDQASDLQQASLQKFYGDQAYVAGKNRASMIRYEGASQARELRKQAKTQAISAVVGGFMDMYSATSGPKTGSQSKVNYKPYANASKGSYFANAE